MECKYWLNRDDNVDFGAIYNLLKPSYNQPDLPCKMSSRLVQEICNCRKLIDTRKDNSKKIPLYDRTFRFDCEVAYTVKYVR